MTLAQLLSDLRYVASSPCGRRATELDPDVAEALVDIGWARTLRTAPHLIIADAGLDVLFACRDVALPIEAA